MLHIHLHEEYERNLLFWKIQIHFKLSAYTYTHISFFGHLTKSSKITSVLQKAALYSKLKRLCYIVPQRCHRWCS